MRALILCSVAATLLAGCGRETAWTAGELSVAVDARGRVVRLADASTGTDYRWDGVTSPLLSLQIDGVLHPPRSFDWDAEDGTATLQYSGQASARVRVTPKATHLVLEVVAVDPRDRVELVVWGPYATTIADTIGETVGVVRNGEFAIGVQALNMKTLGGLPWRDNDFPPQVDLFEDGDYSDLGSEVRRAVLYRVEAAKPEEFGSTLQAYTRDRRRDRVIENWSHDRYVAPAFADGGVVGSKIALFGVPVTQALETVGAIEVAEGLPHPTVDGEWGKTARSASAAYLILDFTERDIDRAIAWTKRAGLRYVYHPEPFATWGHFVLSPTRFPNGRAGLRRAVERAEAQGIHVGVHTLSNFITTNDAYVTPVPDPRLARVGASVLGHDIDATQMEIPVASPEFFAQLENNTLRTVVIGHELVRYRAVSEQVPWLLLDCERGAFGTTAAAHRAGDGVALLADHAYRVFLTDAELSREVATNLADLFNETGLRQISFDGLEGNQSTGMGNYGEVLFTTTWHEHLSNDIRRHLIADASRTSHFFWHVYTRMNWGEPWYAGFRESQTEYRLKNQPYFRRNYMPGMLGWFRMTEGTTVEDVEWMLARSAAFDAGYAFVTGYAELDGNGFTERILDAIGLWEGARMVGAFTAEQRSRMEDVGREFRLEAAGPDTYTLTEIHPQVFRHERGVRQPGEPTSSSFDFENSGAEQVLEWMLSAEDGEATSVRIAIDDQSAIDLPVRLREGWSLRYEGGNRVVVRDAANQVQRELAVNETDFRIAPGRHSVMLDCRLDPDAKAKVRLEVRPRGEPERVPAT